MKDQEKLYPLVEWTLDGTIVAPDGLFIAGAARGPRREGERRVIQGRDAWQQHDGGRLITNHHAAWIISGGLRPGSKFELVWFEGGSHDVIDTYESIRHWLRSEAVMMRSYAEQTEYTQQVVDVVEALVQIELALEFVPRSKAPSYGAPRRSDRH